MVSNNYLKIKKNTEAHVGSVRKGLQLVQATEKKGYIPHGL